MDAIKSNEMAWGSKKKFGFQQYEGKFIIEHPDTFGTDCH